MIRMMMTAALACAATVAATGAALAQAGSAASSTAASVPAGVGAEFMVFETGRKDEVHEHFVNGLALLHNFEYARAAAAFREAQAADPDFVMAYWGEAMTHNHPLWERQDRDAALAALAKLGATAPERRAKARSPREAAWLDAVETLYGDGGTKEERDFLYLARMRALHEADPADIDARAFTGLAVLGTSHGGRNVALYMEAAGVLEPGFMTHQQHPGILHYLIHSYDDPVHAPLGERMAERYALVAPDAGHAQHMISHIYHALGDWEASERANVLADAVVDRQRMAAGRGPGDCGHYNEWLVYARLQQGKDASDIVSACRAQAEAQVTAGTGWGDLSSYATIAGWQGVDTGVWPQPLEAEGEGFAFARFKLAHAQAISGFGEGAQVVRALEQMRSEAAVIARNLATRNPDDRTTLPWVERAIAQAEAIRMLAAGQSDAGLAALRAAAEAESALPAVFGPPAIAKPSWELFGEELLKADRHAEAATAFRRSLEFAPARKLSLEGLEAAVRGATANKT